MEPINLPPLGQIQLEPPRSFAAVYDLVNVYGTLKDKPSKLARLCCAALGICWASTNEGKRPPEYDLSEGDPVAYGGVVMHWLAKQKVDLAPVYEGGIGLIGKVYDCLPSSGEVEAAKDFSVVSAEG